MKEPYFIIVFHASNVPDLSFLSCLPKIQSIECTEIEKKVSLPFIFFLQYLKK